MPSPSFSVRYLAVFVVVALVLMGLTWPILQDVEAGPIVGGLVIGVIAHLTAAYADRKRG